MTRHRRTPLPHAARRALEAQRSSQFAPDPYADTIAAGADADIVDTLGALDGFAADRLELMRDVKTKLNTMPKVHRLRSADIFAAHFARLAAGHQDRDRNIALCVGWQRMKTAFALDTLTGRLQYAQPGTEPTIRSEISASQDAAARAFWASGARLVGEVMPIEAVQRQG